MKIDYTKVIKNILEPKLAFNGFKYNKEESNEQLGEYFFTRIYWSKLQYISIARVQYELKDVEEVLADGRDRLEVVPAECLLIEEWT